MLDADAYRTDLELRLISLSKVAETNKDTDLEAKGPPQRGPLFLERRLMNGKPGACVDKPLDRLWPTTNISAKRLRICGPIRPNRMSDLQFGCELQFFRVGAPQIKSLFSQLKGSKYALFDIRHLGFMDEKFSFPIPLLSSVLTRTNP